MAQRFYFESTAEAGVSPAATAHWQASPSLTRKVLKPSPHTGSSSTNLTCVVNNNATPRMLNFQALYQFTFGGTIQIQTVKYQIRADVPSNEVEQLYSIGKIVSSDGSVVRGYLWGGAASAEIATQNASSSFLNQGDSFTIASVSHQANDWLCVEMGAGPGTIDSNENFITFNVGTSGASDLPEDNTTGTTLRPWIEFANNILVPVVSLPMRRNTRRMYTRRSFR
jgi:hypothetical protein